MSSVGRGWRLSKCVALRLAGQAADATFAARSRRNAAAASHPPSSPKIMLPTAFAARTFEVNGNSSGEREMATTEIGGGGLGLETAGVDIASALTGAGAMQLAVAYGGLTM